MKTKFIAEMVGTMVLVLMGCEMCIRDRPSIMRYTLIDSTGYSFSISVAWDAYGGSVRCVKE